MRAPSLIVLLGFFFEWLDQILVSIGFHKRLALLDDFLCFTLISWSSSFLIFKVGVPTFLFFFLYFYFQHNPIHEMFNVKWQKTIVLWVLIQIVQTNHWRWLSWHVNLTCQKWRQPHMCKCVLCISFNQSLNLRTYANFDGKYLNVWDYLDFWQAWSACQDDQIQWLVWTM